MRRGCAVSFVALTVLVVTMVATCPTAVNHKVVLREATYGAIQDKLNATVGSELGGLLMDMAQQSSIGSISTFSFDRIITVDNYYLFSVGRIVLPGNSHIVSIGIFGHVFAPGKDEILELSKRYRI